MKNQILILEKIHESLKPKPKVRVWCLDEEGYYLLDGAISQVRLNQAQFDYQKCMETIDIVLTPADDISDPM